MAFLGRRVRGDPRSRASGSNLHLHPGAFVGVPALGSMAGRPKSGMGQDRKRSVKCWIVLFRRQIQGPKFGEGLKWHLISKG